MFQTLKNAWVIKEIRNKILFTVMIILIFRIGSVIPVPFVNPEVLKAATDNSFFNYLSIDLVKNVIIFPEGGELNEHRPENPERAGGYGPAASRHG